MSLVYVRALSDAKLMSDVRFVRKAFCKSNFYRAVAEAKCVAHLIAITLSHMFSHWKTSLFINIVVVFCYKSQCTSGR